MSASGKKPYLIPTLRLHRFTAISKMLLASVSGDQSSEKVEVTFDTDVQPKWGDTWEIEL